MYHSETIPQRCRQKACPCRCPDQCKFRQIQADRSGGSSFSDYNVDRIVFHGRIEYLLHLTVQAVDLIYEKHIALLQIIKDCRHLPRFFDRRSRGDLDIYPHLIGNDTGKRRLSKSRRSIEKDMIQRIASLLCRFDINF